MIQKYRNLEVFFEVEKKKKEIKSIEAQLSTKEVWKDPKKSHQLSKNKKDLEEDIKLVENLSQKKEEIEVLIELLEEGENVEKEINQALDSIEQILSEAEMRTLFTGKDDPRNAILTIHPGAGGTESQDWAQILLRMYLRWAERKGFQTEIVDYLPGEEAGIKSVTMQVKGSYAYGYLSQESGVHRLVRISPFDANKRRHTSFAAVFVYPEIEEDIEVKINTEDLRIDTFRSSGRGGQHVNVTDSAVRITHLPTGIVVQCQNERSQHQNKETAMKILRARLYELERRKMQEKLEKIEETKSDIAWGNQIRSYVLQPYQLIKDLRTKVEIGDVNRVLDGDIDEFIKASLIKRRKEKKS